MKKISNLILVIVFLLTIFGAIITGFAPFPYKFIGLFLFFVLIFYPLIEPVKIKNIDIHRNKNNETSNKTKSPIPKESPQYAPRKKSSTILLPTNLINDQLIDNDFQNEIGVGLSRFQYTSLLLKFFQDNRTYYLSTEKKVMDFIYVDYLLERTKDRHTKYWGEISKNKFIFSTLENKPSTELIENKPKINKDIIKPHLN